MPNRQPAPVQRAGAPQNDSPFLVILLVAFTFTFVFIFVLVGTKIQLHQINDEFLSDTILTRRIKEHEEWTLIAGHNNLPINVARYENQRLREFDLTWDLDRHAVWGKLNNSRTDLIRLRMGHVHGQVWVAGVNCSGHPAETVQQLYEQIDTFKRLIEKHSQDLALCRSVEELRHAIDAHRIGSLLAVKGGHSINAKLSLLRSLHALGVRSMSLASEHNCCDWADSSIVDELDNGIAGSRGDLSIWGRLVVWEMNRLGMIVDLSYGSYGVALDVLRYSRAPVIYSNAGAYGVHPHHRNVHDDVLKQLAARAGIVMISFDPTILGGYTIDNVVEHLNYLRDAIGVDHIGIGTGFDGFNSVLQGLEDVSKIGNLFEALAKGQYSDGETYPAWPKQDIRKIAAENYLRLFGHVEQIRERLSHEPAFEDDDTDEVFG